MTIPQDKIAHLVAGALVALCAVVLLWIARTFGLPLAMLAAGAAVGVAYEVVQKIRGDGEPDPMDALASAVGAALAALGAWWLS